MAQAEVAVQILALGERENARSGHDAVAAYHQTAIVQDRLGMKDREDEFLCEFGVDRHAGFHKTFEIDVALDRDEGAEAFAGKLEHRVGDVLDGFAFLRGRSEKPVAAELGERAAEFGLENHHERNREENGNAPEQPADHLQIQKLRFKNQREKNQRKANENAGAVGSLEIRINVVNDRREDRDLDAGGPFLLQKCKSGLKHRCGAPRLCEAHGLSYLRTRN